MTAFTLLLTCGVAAAINVAVDPFGYFGLNKTGLFFNDERSFKLVQVRRYPHDALLLGDSRVAYIDPAPITSPRFFNAAFGGSTFEERVWFWERYLGHARVVVVGMLDGEANTRGGVSAQLTDRSWRDVFRYTLSFELLRNSVDAVARWRASEPPAYQDNGARNIADRYLRDAMAGRPSPAAIAPYSPDRFPPTRPVRNLCRTDVGPPPETIPGGLEQIGRMAELAREREAKLIVYLHPRHPEELTPNVRASPALTSYVCHLGLDFYDLSDAWTDAGYFWSTDHTHYFPGVGVAFLERILRESGVDVIVE